MNKSCEHRIRSRIAVTALGLVLFCAGTAHAMRGAVDGNEPVKDGPWPDGVAAVADLPSRFVYSVGDSLGVATDWEFLYSGDADAFQQALLALAKVRAPAVELAIHNAPCTLWTAKLEEERGRHVDWALTVWSAEGWHYVFNNPLSLDVGSPNIHKPVAAPRIDVWVASHAFPKGIDWSRVKVPEGIRVDDRRASVLDLIPIVGATVRGTIYDMANGKTIAGARVEAQKSGDKGQWQPVSESKADAAGLFQIKGLPHGRYKLIAFASAIGYAPRALYLDLAPARDPLHKVDIELSMAVTVEGTVTDDHDKPLPGIRVRLQNTLGIDARDYYLPGKMARGVELEADTDASGRFSFAEAPTGYAQFECKGPGYQQLNSHTLWKLYSWDTLGDRGRSLRKTGKVPVVLRMAAPGTIRCKVVSPDGKPPQYMATIAGAEGGYSETMGRLHRWSSFERDGTAVFTDVPPGRYYVAYGGRVDMHPDAKIVTVTAGQTVEVEIPSPPERKPKTE